MLQYQKIDISERIDVNKTNASKECKLSRIFLINIALKSI